MDVGIVLGADVFEFWVEGFVAGAGESGIAFRHLEEGISLMEVGVVVISWQPAESCVGDFIGFPCKLLAGALVILSIEYILIL